MLTRCCNELHRQRRGEVFSPVMQLIAVHCGRENLAPTSVPIVVLGVTMHNGVPPSAYTLNDTPSLPTMHSEFAMTVLSRLFRSSLARFLDHTLGRGRLGVPRAVAQARACAHGAGAQRGQQPQRRQVAAGVLGSAVLAYLAPVRQCRQCPTMIRPSTCGSTGEWATMYSVVTSTSSRPLSSSIGLRHHRVAIAAGQQKVDVATR